MKFARGLTPDEPCRILGSGIDSLVLAVTLQWADDATFAELAQLKAAAKAQEDEEPITITVGDDATAARFTVKPHGGGGFEWLLVSREMTISLGNWLEPKQRPSAMVDVRSETLWAHGPDVVVQRSKDILEAMGATVEGIKPSRVDLCVDVLLREEDWHAELSKHFVTRARGTSTHMSNGDLSGFSIGKGAASARIYDKAREIREKSHKDWMFDVWKLPAVPGGHRAVRVEFQLRRDALRETKVNTWEEARGKLLRVWAYCTKRWLRLAVDARLHHTQQKLLPWWSIVQDGLRGAQQAEPLVREKAKNADKKRLAAQSIGTLSSIAALDMKEGDRSDATVLDRASFLHSALAEALRFVNIGDREFTRRIDRKRAAYTRSAPGFRLPEAKVEEPTVDSGLQPKEDRG